jgi:hypothetical protein
MVVKKAQESWLKRTMDKKTVEITLLKGQANLLANTKDSTLAAIAGTGGGKTQTGYWWLHSRMEAHPGNTWLVVEPTYNMLGKIIINSSDPNRPSLEEYFRRIGHRPFWISKKDKIMGTEFGKIYLGSADNPDSMQGAAVMGVWLDEAGQMKVSAYDTARQRVSMMRGQVLITTTPYNQGWLKSEVFERATSPDQNIAVEVWKSIDRPGYPLERYAEEKRKLPSWRFAMMYDGKFENPSGLIYQAFDERICMIERFPIPGEWLVYSGHDFGGANPAAVFYAQDPATGNFFLFAEYLPGSGRSTYEHVQEFKRITAGHNTLKRVGGSHQEDEIRQGYSSHGWIICEPKIHSVESQIDRIIGMHRLNKIFIFRDMRNYLDEKRSFARNLDEQGKVTERIENEDRFHLMAAERYILSDFRPETAVATASPIPIDY